MAACPSCGKENPDNARFCNNCATPLAGESREQRKTVTVLFCDLTGSTALGESTDPEALRALLARYFERMKRIVESLGGTVEKFIGDAVMAVFGVPAAHEDDALRACRAAVEMRDALPELGIRGRIGVNTGEVVTGTAERLATGDAVNVAARFEQAAEPGEVLIGESTYALVRDAVTVEAVEALTLKGKSGPVAAFRLVRVGEAPERLHGDVFVGRERELEEIAAAWVRAGAEQRCELVTIVAEAGVGKTRLAAEALQRLGATVVRGRCLSYGEGITYWPVLEVVKQLGTRPSDPSAAAAIASLLGETDSGTSAEEIAWAFRKLLEEQAPLVCVFEDVHWGEETFLNLVEHVALLSAGAQVLLLCTARPELLERRHVWPATVRLAPLERADADRLVPPSLAAELREQIVRVAGGNPLFVTEMVAMANSSDGEISVPPTLRALLTARLDQLDAADRHVLDRAAVEGEMFHRGAVQALALEEPEVTARLAALVRRELIRPDRAQIPGEDGFRFRHTLIRDAAYEALPKAARAELHERYAGWLAERVAQGYEAIVGHHLEQAHRFRAELGLDGGALAERAGRSLGAAGRVALSRSDSPGAVSLLSRALELLAEHHPERGELLIAFCEAALAVGEYEHSMEAADELIRLGCERNDPRFEWRGRLQVALTRTYVDPTVTAEEGERVAETAIPILERHGDEAGLGRAFFLLATMRHLLDRSEEAEEALGQALEHAQRSGDVASEAEIMPWLASHSFFGSTPVEQAHARLERMLVEAQARSLMSVEGVVLRFLGGIQGLRGDFDNARELFDRARAILSELGSTNWLAWTLVTGYVAFVAGDYRAAEREYRFGYDEHERMGETAIRSTNAAVLAEALCEQGRHDEAEHYVQICRDTASADDHMSQTSWRRAAALLLARRGELRESERLAREAVALIPERQPELWDPHNWATLGETLALAGKPDEAEQALARALQLHEQKGNLAGTRRTQELAQRLHVQLP